MRYRLYKISADGGESFSTQWLTPEDYTELTERYGFLVEKVDLLWDTKKIMSEIVTRYKTIERTQNPSNARDFLQEVKDEIDKILEEKQ